MALKEVVSGSGDSIDAFSPTEELDLNTPRIISANLARIKSVERQGFAAAESLLFLEPPKPSESADEDATERWTWQLPDIDLPNRKMLDELYEIIGVDRSQSTMDIVADGGDQKIRLYHNIPGGLKIVESLTVIAGDKWSPHKPLNGTPNPIDVGVQWSEFKAYVTTPDVDLHAN
jgi:hypothetical protein